MLTYYVQVKSGRERAGMEQQAEVTSGPTGITSWYSWKYKENGINCQILLQQEI